MARVLALLAAVLLVVAAVIVRRELDDPDTAAPGTDGGPVDLVACIPELASVCERLEGFEVRIEPPSATVAAPDGVDAWVTFDPWPAIAGDVLGPGQPAGSTNLVLVTRSGGAAGECADWACAGAAGGALPTSEAFGLLALGHASRQWSDATRAGEPFARQELDLPEYRAWLARVDRTKRDPLADMLQLGAAGPPATAALQADVADRVDGSREDANLERTPTGQVAVVVAGRASELVVDELADPLEAAGWTVGPGVSDGIPSAALLRAMREVLG